MSKRSIIFGGTGLLVVATAGIFLLSRNDANPPPLVTSSSPTPALAVNAGSIANLEFAVEHPAITADGRLVFATHRNTALATANADGKGFKLLTGQEFPYIESVAWSPDGSKAIVKSAGNRTVLFTGEGKPLQDLNPSIANVAWSPDGERYAYTFGNDRVPQISEGSGFRGLSETPLGDRFAWSPDGKRLAAFDSQGGDLVIVNLEGGQLTKTGQSGISSVSWSPDGQRLLLTTGKGANRSLVLFDPAASKANPAGLPGIAEKSAWISPEEFLVASPESLPDDYLENPLPLDDKLWRVRADGSKEAVTSFDQEAKAIRFLIDRRLLVVTNTKVYEITLGAR